MTNTTPSIGRKSNTVYIARLRPVRYFLAIQNNFSSNEIVLICSLKRWSIAAGFDMEGYYESSIISITMEINHMGKKKVRIVKCNRCYNEWATRINPKFCRFCKSPYWNSPRVRKRTNKIEGL